MSDRTGGPRRRLPDYADEEEITAEARAADLALLVEARHRGEALAATLTQLGEGAELLTTCRYLDLARDGIGDLADWLDDAAKELKASRTPAEEKAYRDERAELHDRLWRR